jgi:hypothetical protein
VAGFFDLHVALTISKGWASIVSNETKWRSLFPNLPTAMADEWRAKLAPGGDTTHLEIRPSFVPEQTKLPCIVIQYQDEPEESAPMNYWGGVHNPTDSGEASEINNRLVTLMVQMFARVHIFAEHPELTRALHIAVINILLSNRSVLYNVGYHDLEYQGGGDLAVEEELMPNFLGAYIRVQRWSARGTLEYVENPIAGKPVHVYSDDTEVDGHFGGIDTPTES